MWRFHLPVTLAQRIYAFWSCSQGMAGRIWRREEVFLGSGEVDADVQKQLNDYLATKREARARDGLDRARAFVIPGAAAAWLAWHTESHPSLPTGSYAHLPVTLSHSLCKIQCQPKRESAISHV